MSEPERATEMDVAFAILVHGMRACTFTGRRLGDYFGGGRTDWISVRKIINGTDWAELLAGYAVAFPAALPACIDARRSAC